LTLSCIGSLWVSLLGPHGPAEDKLKALSHYKVSLVIENSAEFVSEKLSESIRAGTVPFYIGPPVEIFGTPKELVATAEPNIIGIQAALVEAHGMLYKD
jgi:hypothetical protein